jgi:hypothetical protein
MALYFTISLWVAKAGAKKAFPEFVAVIVAVPVPRRVKILLEIVPTEPLSIRKVVFVRPADEVERSVTLLLGT